MTVLETRTNTAIQSINKKLRDQHIIDWQQRRYEIAKEMMPYCCETSKQILLSRGKLDAEGSTFAEKAASQAVMFADALIKKLKPEDQCS